MSESPFELQAMEVHCPSCRHEFVTYYNSCEASLFARIKDLHQLADAQAAIIAAKNDEIESLRAELSACKAGGNDYAGDLSKDAECGGRGVDGMTLAAGQGG